MLQNMRKNLKNQRGFTLVELLAVIAIIGVLAAIAVPKFSDATATANGAKVASELRMLDSAVIQVAAGKGVDPSTIAEADLKAADETNAAGKMYTPNSWPKAPTSGKVIIGGKTFVAAATDKYTITNGRAIYNGKNVETLLAGQ